MGGAFKRPPPSRRWEIQRPSRARVNQTSSTKSKYQLVLWLGRVCLGCRLTYSLQTPAYELNPTIWQLVFWYVLCRLPLYKFGSFRRSSVGAHGILCALHEYFMSRIHLIHTSSSTHMNVNAQARCYRLAGRYGKFCGICPLNTKFISEKSIWGALTYLKTIKICCVLELCLGVHKNRLWHAWVIPMRAVQSNWPPQYSEVVGWCASGRYVCRLGWASCGKARLDLLPLKPGGALPKLHCKIRHGLRPTYGSIWHLLW